MYILWINCLHSRDNAPQQVPRAGELAGVLNGALSPECKQVYPQGYTQGSKTAAFTLIHRDDDDCGHVPLVVPFRQSIGIDWFEKIQPKSRRSTRAIRAPGYESRRLRDIIQASWYLNSNGKLRVDLTDHMVTILDQIKSDALAHGFDI